ncbi:MAG TPA: HEAT repeat domain-containing protein [Planctomycetota bacterium]|nr:HEAT repeat domain-containing protein [Planctomycetota bacterium]
MRSSFSTPEELNARVETLLKYFDQSGAAEYPAAYKALLSHREDLIRRLPGLIAKHEGNALIYLAKAAAELNASNALPALINRLGDSSQGVLSAGKALVEAIDSFSEPEARKFILNAMSGSNGTPRNALWHALGPRLTDEQLALALKITASGGPECFDAAEVLTRYATTFERSSVLRTKIQELLEGKKGDARLALILAAAGMDSAAVNSWLQIFLYDSDLKVRQIVVQALGRSPDYKPIVIDLIKSDAEPDLRKAAVRVLGAHQDDAVLALMIDLLNDDALQREAHCVLVRANNAKDLGWFDFVWKEWLASGGARAALATRSKESGNY